MLRAPGMVAVFGAHSVSMTGSVAAEVALSIVIYERTGSALLSALVFVCTFLPYAIAGTLLSSLADRFPGRRVLVICDLLSTVLIAAMVVAATPPVWLLLVLLVGIGLIAPVFQGARAASLSTLLPVELFPIGRSLLRLISQVAVLVGFALGGLIVGLIGARWLLAADAVSFGLSAALIGLATPYVAAHASAEGSPSLGALARASAAGLHHVFTSPQLRWLVPFSWAAALFNCSIDGLAVAYTGQVDVVATTAAALFAGASIGTVVGEVVVSRRPSTVRRRLVLPLALLTQLPMIGFLAVPPIWAAALILVVSGFGFSYNQGVDPLILTATDPSFRGRIFTLQSSGLMTVQGVGIAIWGAVGLAVAPSTVLVSAAALGVITITALGSRALRGSPNVL